MSDLRITPASGSYPHPSPLTPLHLSQKCQPNQQTYSTIQQLKLFEPQWLYNGQAYPSYPTWPTVITATLTRTLNPSPARQQPGADQQLQPRWPITYKRDCPETSQWQATGCRPSTPCCCLSPMTLRVTVTSPSLTTEIRSRSYQEAVQPHRFNHSTEHPLVTQVELPMM